MDTLTLVVDYVLSSEHQHMEAAARRAPRGFEVISLHRWHILRLVSKALHRRFTNAAVPAFIAYARARFRAEISIAISSLTWPEVSTTTADVRPDTDPFAACGCAGQLLHLCVTGQRTSDSTMMSPFAYVLVPSNSNIRMTLVRVTWHGEYVWRSEHQVDRYYAQGTREATARRAAAEPDVEVDVCYTDDLGPFAADRFVWSIVPGKDGAQPARLLYTPQDYRSRCH